METRVTGQHSTYSCLVTSTLESLPSSQCHGLEKGADEWRKNIADLFLINIFICQNICDEIEHTFKRKLLSLWPSKVFVLDMKSVD